MRSSLLVLAALLVVVGTAAGPGHATHDPAKGPKDKDRSGYDVILNATNEHRRAYGLPSASPSQKLFQAAWDYAAFLFKVDGASHTSDGKDVAKRVREAGFAFCFAAENLYFYWSTAPINPNEMAAKAMAFWKQSSSHNPNMLHKHSSHIGVGVASGPHGSKYIFKAVQVFGAPTGSCR